MLCSSIEPPHRFEHFRSSRLRGVELVRGFHRGPPTRWQFWPMVQIASLESGSARLWAHGRSAVMNAGDTVISAPGSSPRVVERLTETATTCTVWITPAMFDRALHGPRARDLGVAVIHADARIGAAMAALEAALRQDAGDVEPLVQRLIHTACEVTRSAPLTRLPSGPLRPEIARAQRILHEQLHRSISLDQLTHDSGLSKFHFVRLFREEMGTTPHAYVLKLRVARARELLDRGVPAAQVAFECGFSDQAHFTRAFKREVGYTPAVFARLG